MKIICYSYSDNGKQYLGGVKELPNGSYALLLQDKHSPFCDVLGDYKNAVFSSFEQALAFLEDFLRERLSFRNVVSVSPKEGIF